MKNRGNESVFSTGALVLMLSLTLFYGCRAFDPEPVIVNLAPDTFVIGGPAEDTGTGFRRHLYWYGTDRDGDVVQFIYAINDTTVRDDEDTTEDEENRRFNPALDITTVTEPEGFVGWTTKTDSVFVFTIDREADSSKQITFHIVSVDDRGAIDPTPARLRFFNNATGLPRIKFRLYANVDVDTGEGGELRWVGDPVRGADADSPEQTDDPFVGFQRPFRIEWEGSTPNVTDDFGNGVLGYRYKAIQGPGFPFVPDVDDSLGTKIFDPEVTSFFYQNSTVAPESLGTDCDTERGIGCDPTIFRWPSGAYVLSVETIDRALVQNRLEAGQLTFQVNYPPQTIIEPDASYVVRDESGDVLTQGTFQDGDRIPYRSEVTFVSTGFDRFRDSLPPGVDPNVLCCDVPFGTGLPEVRFTERVSGSKLEDVGEPPRPFASPSGSPNELGTVTFLTGPYDYTYTSLTIDELGRFDNVPAEFDFSVGFAPSLRPDLALPAPDRGLDRLVVGLVSVVEGDSLLLKQRESRTAFLVKDPAAQPCGARLVLNEDEIRDDEIRVAYPGQVFTISPRLVGTNDPRDPAGTIRAWSFTLNSVNDPDNSIQDGLESRTLRDFYDGTSPNVLDFREDPVASNPDFALEFFVPITLYNPFLAANYDPDSDIENDRQMGCLLVQRLGEMKLAYRGRVTAATEDPIDFFQNRNEAGQNVYLEESVRLFGAKTETEETTFFIYVAVDANNNGIIEPDQGDRLWPDAQALGGSK